MWIRCLTGMERERSRGQRYGVRRWLVGNGIRCSTFHDTRRQTPDTWPGTEMEEVGDKRINSTPYWRCHSRGNRGFWDRARFRSVSAWLGRLNTFGLFQEKRLRFILHWTSSEVVLLKICFLIVQELDFQSFCTVEVLGYLLSSFSSKWGSVDVYTLKNKHSLLALMVPWRISWNLSFEQKVLWGTQNGSFIATKTLFWNPYF